MPHVVNADSAKSEGAGGRCPPARIAARSLYRDALTLCNELSNRRRAAYTVERLASLSLAVGDAVRFVTLRTGNAMRERLGAPADPSEREDWPENLARARAISGEVCFGMTWNEGCALPWEQAIELVLNE